MLDVKQGLLSQPYSSLALQSDSRPSNPSERPLHILLLSPTHCQMGGADRDWITLANALGPKEVRISWGGSQGSECLRPYIDDEVLANLFDLELPWFTYLIQENAYEPRSRWLWTKILADHLLQLRRPLRKLSRTMKDIPIDVVVSNTAAVTLGAVYAGMRGLPHVWSVKECLDPSVTACRRFAKWIVRMSSAAIVPSSSAAIPFGDAAHILPDGSDVKGIRLIAQRSSRAEILSRLGLPFELPVVAQIGGIVFWKGQQITAEAFLRLSARSSVPSFSLLFLGGGSDVHRQNIERTLSKAPSQWRDLVRFVRFEPGDFSYLSAADIVVHPSVLPDPYPNAVREAMILGKPVIASRGGGITDMINDGENGILFEPGNAEQMATALTELIGSAGERCRLGQAAYSFAGEHFSIDFRKQAFITLLRGLVLSRRAATAARG